MEWGGMVVSWIKMGRLLMYVIFCLFWQNAQERADGLWSVYDFRSREVLGTDGENFGKHSFYHGLPNIIISFSQV